MIDNEYLTDLLDRNSLSVSDIKVHKDDDFLVIETEEATLDIDILTDLNYFFGTGLTVDYGEHGLDIYIYGIND